MLPPLTNFAIQKYYQNETRFNGVYSRNNLPKIKELTFAINLGGNKPIGAHWIALYVNADNVIYFDSFGVEHIPKEIKKFIGNRNVATNPFRIQACDSLMYGHLCIGFIDFWWKKSITLFVVNIKILKTLKYYTFSKKLLVLFIICSRLCSNDEKRLKEEESIEISKILDLFINIEEYQNKYDWRKHRPRI